MVIGIIAVLAACFSALICIGADGFADLTWLWLLPVGWLGCFVGILLLAFLVILYLTKIIALASIGSALAVFSAMIIWRHRANLERIKNGNENKISWM